VIAVDTNLLVYAHREDSPWHDSAATRIRELAEHRHAGRSCGPASTSSWRSSPPRIRPAEPEVALDQVEAWLEAPSLVLLAEAEGYWPGLRAALVEGRIAGPLVHDARVAALCQLHGVRELWTVDRDFSRFPGLVARNPLVAG
jgi:predicted nucleic acid-binding protein